MKFPSISFCVRLSAFELGLFAYFYLYKSRDYKVCMTYSLLVRKTGASRGTLLRAIKNLEEKGLLSTVKRYFRYRDTFSHRNCYHLIAPMPDDVVLPLKEIISLPLSLDEKGLLLYLHYLAGEGGDTFMTKSEILQSFKPRPHKAFKNLCDKGYIEQSRCGVKLSADLLCIGITDM